MNRRNYRNSLDFVEQGFRACWRNASDLTAASKLLLDASQFAPATSLGILAIEELGKLCAIDGLLFAKPDDNRTAAFKRAQRDHASKLLYFTGIPFMIINAARVDPRAQDDGPYGTAIAISNRELGEAIDAVAALTGHHDLSLLDEWKQKSFYVGLSENKFVAPSEVISPELANGVHRLAWRATTTIDFVFSDGNLERYFGLARSVRAKINETQLEALADAARELVAEIVEDARAELDGEQLH